MGPSRSKNDIAVLIGDGAAALKRGLVMGSGRVELISRVDEAQQYLQVFMRRIHQRSRRYGLSAVRFLERSSETVKHAELFSAIRGGLWTASSIKVFNDPHVASIGNSPFDWVFAGSLAHRSLEALKFRAEFSNGIGSREACQAAFRKEKHADNGRIANLCICNIQRSSLGSVQCVDTYCADGLHEPDGTRLS